MACKMNNTAIKLTKWSSNKTDVKYISYKPKNGSAAIQWAKTVSVSTVAPSGVTISISRTSSKEPSASIGTVSGNLYYGDGVKVTVSVPSTTGRLGTIRATTVSPDGTTTTIYSITNTNRVYSQSFTGTVYDGLDISVTIHERCTIRLNEGTGRTITNVKIKSGTSTLTGSPNSNIYAYEGDTITATEGYETGYSSSKSSISTPTSSYSHTVTGTYTYNQSNAPYFWWKIASKNAYTLACSIIIEDSSYNMTTSSQTIFEDTATMTPNFANAQMTFTLDTTYMSSGRKFAYRATTIPNSNSFYTSKPSTGSMTTSITLKGILIDSQPTSSSDYTNNLAGKTVQCLIPPYKINGRCLLAIYAGAYHDWFSWGEQKCSGWYSGYSNGLVGYGFSAMNSVQYYNSHRSSISYFTPQNVASNSGNAYSSQTVGSWSLYGFKTTGGSGGLGDILGCGNQTVWNPKEENSTWSSGKEHLSVPQSGCESREYGAWSGNYSTTYYCCGTDTWPTNTLDKCYDGGGLANYGTHHFVYARIIDSWVPAEISATYTPYFK